MPDNLTASELQDLIDFLTPVTLTATTIDPALFGPTAPSGLRLVSEA
jgi:hypothetical protein